jgi:hypothetical protein
VELRGNDAGFHYENVRIVDPVGSDGAIVLGYGGGWTIGQLTVSSPLGIGSGICVSGAGCHLTVNQIYFGNCALSYFRMGRGDGPVSWAGCSFLGFKCAIMGTCTGGAGWDVEENCSLDFSHITHALHVFCEPGWATCYQALNNAKVIVRTDDVAWKNFANRGAGGRKFVVSTGAFVTCNDMGPVPGTGTSIGEGGFLLDLAAGLTRTLGLGFQNTGGFAARIQPSGSMVANWNLTLPTTPPATSGFALVADATGVCSWASVGGSGSVGGGTANQLALFGAATSITAGLTLGNNQVPLGRASATPIAQTVGAATIGSTLPLTWNEGSGADYWNNAVNTVASINTKWAAAALRTTVSDSSGTITPNFSLSGDHTVNLTGTGRTMAAPTSAKAGQRGVIYLVQDSTGSRTITTWDSAYKFTNGTNPLLTTTAGATDVIRYIVKSSTEIYCFFTPDMRAHFTGAGDVATGAVAWWGLRAYNAAARGTKAVRLRRDSDNVEQDFNTSIEGNLDTAGILTFKGAANVFVTKLYDQSGNSQDLIQTTLTFQPQLLLNVLGSKPAMFFNGVSELKGDALTVTATQPFTISTVSARTSSYIFRYPIVLAVAPAIMQLSFSITAGIVELNAGASFTAPATENTFHAFNCFVDSPGDSPTSNLNVDGTDTLGDTGTDDVTASPMYIGGNSSSGTLVGYVCEAGVWEGNVVVVLSPNQRAYWGIPAAAPVRYVGPGDIQAGATGWWGLRAYTAAKAGTKAVRLRRDSDQAESDFNTLLNGDLDVASITTFKGAANLFVRTLYDQTGNGHDATQTTAANQPQFTLSGLGTLPVITCTGTQEMVTSSFATTPLAAPYTIAAAYKVVTAGDQALAGNGATLQVRPGQAGANGLTLFAGTALSRTDVTDGTWWAVQCNVNGASSTINRNGSTLGGTGNAGSNGSSSLTLFSLGSLSTPFKGQCVEIGVWNALTYADPPAFNMILNKRSYWKF